MKTKGNFHLRWQVFDQMPLEILIKSNTNICYKSEGQNKRRDHLKYIFSESTISKDSEVLILLLLW